MNIAFYTSRTGLVAYQEGLNQISHNIANVNTDGYKTGELAFKDLIYSEMDTTNGEENLYGHGVKANSKDLIMSQGNFRTSGRDLDFALNGEGFFALDDGSGVTKYTRNGAMAISVEEDANYLVAFDGSYVVDAEGQKIAIPYALEESPNSAEGEFTGDIDTDRLKKTIAVYDFSNKYGLTQIDSTRFQESSLSGAPLLMQDEETGQSTASMLVGVLEASNVDLGTQMTNMIVIQRAYQLNAKVVQTADQIEEIVNSLR